MKTAKPMPFRVDDEIVLFQPSHSMWIKHLNVSAVGLYAKLKVWNS